MIDMREVNRKLAAQKDDGRKAENENGGYLDSFLGNFVAGLEGVASGAASFVGLDDWADSIDQSAQESLSGLAPTVDPALSWEYISSPGGLTADVGSLLGSELPFALAMMATGGAAGAAAKGLTTAAKAGKISRGVATGIRGAKRGINAINKAAEAGSFPARLAQAGLFTMPGTALEAATEAGSAVSEQRHRNDGEISDEERDRIRNDVLFGNMLGLTATNTLEALPFLKLLGKSGKAASPSLTRRLLGNLGEAGAGALSEAYEEGMQQGFQRKALDGGTWEQAFIPTEWNEEQWGEFSHALAPSLLLGGLGAGYNTHRGNIAAQREADARRVAEETRKHIQENADNVRKQDDLEAELGLQGLDLQSDAERQAQTAQNYADVIRLQDEWNTELGLRGLQDLLQQPPKTPQQQQDEILKLRQDEWHKKQQQALIGYLSDPANERVPRYELLERANKIRDFGKGDFIKGLEAYNAEAAQKIEQGQNYEQAVDNIFNPKPQQQNTQSKVSPKQYPNVREAITALGNGDVSKGIEKFGSMSAAEKNAYLSDYEALQQSNHIPDAAKMVQAQQPQQPNRVVAAAQQTQTAPQTQPIEKQTPVEQPTQAAKPAQINNQLELSETDDGKYVASLDGKKTDLDVDVLDTLDEWNDRKGSMSVEGYADGSRSYVFDRKEDRDNFAKFFNEITQPDNRQQSKGEMNNESTETPQTAPESSAEEAGENPNGKNSDAGKGEVNDEPSQQQTEKVEAKPETTQEATHEVKPKKKERGQKVQAGKENPLNKTKTGKNIKTRQQAADRFQQILEGSKNEAVKKSAEATAKIYSAFLDNLVKMQQSLGIQDATIQRVLEKWGLTVDSLAEDLAKRNPSQGQTRYQMAGLEAKTVNRKKLEQAFKLYENGEDNDVIFDKTGFVFGQDGQPRFYIADKLDGIKFDKLKDVVDKEWRSIRLENIYKNNALYKAYPWLREIAIKAKTDGEGYLGYADFDDKSIMLYVDLDEKGNVVVNDEMKRTLVHEIQHLIQGFEDFAIGGSPDAKRVMAKIAGLNPDTITESQADDVYFNLLGEMEARQTEDTASRQRLIDEQRKRGDIANAKFNAEQLRRDLLAQYADENAFVVTQEEMSKYEAEAADEESAAAKAMRDYLGTVSDTVQALQQTDYQSGGETVKGAITFGKDGKTVIETLQNADQSTVVHELAHLFLEEYKTLAAAFPNSDIAKDVAKIKKWAEWNPNQVGEYDNTATKAEFAARDKEIKKTIAEIKRLEAGLKKNEFGREIIKEFAARKKKDSGLTKEKFVEEKKAAAEKELSDAKEKLQRLKEEWQHERFARGFEEYLRTGEAKQDWLKKVFEQFKEWLTKIYKEVIVGGEFSPEVKAAVRKMLGDEFADDKSKSSTAIAAESIGDDAKMFFNKTVNDDAKTSTVRNALSRLDKYSDTVMGLWDKTDAKDEETIKVLERQLNAIDNMRLHCEELLAEDMTDEEIEQEVKDVEDTIDKINRQEAAQERRIKKWGKLTKKADKLSDLETRADKIFGVKNSITLNSDERFTQQSISYHWRKAKQIADADLTPQEKKWQEFGKLMGLDVKIFSNDNKFLNGRVNVRTGEMYLNRNAAANISKTFWHETFHPLVANNPQLMRELKEALKVSDDVINQYRRGRDDLKTASDDAVLEEILADNMADAAKRLQLFKDVAAKDRSLIERFIGWIKDMLDKFVSVFHNPTGKLTTAQRDNMARVLAKMAGELKDGNGNKIFKVDGRGNIALADGRELRAEFGERRAESEKRQSASDSDDWRNSVENGEKDAYGIFSRPFRKLAKYLGLNNLDVDDRITITKAESEKSFLEKLSPEVRNEVQKLLDETADTGTEFTGKWLKKERNLSDEVIKAYGKAMSLRRLDGFINPFASFLSSPRRIAEKYPVFKPVFNMAQKAMDLLVKKRREYLGIYKEALELCGSEKGIDRMFEIMLLGDEEKRNYTEAELKDWGEADGVIKGYLKMRELMKLIHDELDAARRKANPNAKPLADIEGYIPHFFYSYMVREKSDDGKGIIHGSARNLNDAIALAEKALADLPQGKELVICPKTLDFAATFGKDFAPTIMGEKDYARLTQSLAKNSELTLKEARDAMRKSARTTNGHRFDGSFLHRTGAKGYIKDMRKVMEQHIYASSRYIAMETEFKPQAIKYFEKTFGAFDKEYSGMAKYLKEYINDVNGTPTALEKTLNEWLNRKGWWKKSFGAWYGDRAAVYVANKIAGITTVAKLGCFNISSGMVNLLQSANVAGYLGNPNAMWQVWQRGLQSKYSDKENDILDRTNVREDIGLTSVSGYDQGRFSGWADKTMYFFSGAEGVLRRGTVLVAYDAKYKSAYAQARKDGLSEADAKKKADEAAIEYAVEINDKSNFDMSVVDSPNIFRRGSVLSQLLLQFKKYSVKQTEVMIDMLTAATDSKQKAVFWGTYFLFSGLFQLPFSEWLDENVLENFFGRSYKREIKKYMMQAAGNSPTGKELAKVAMYGLPSIFGVDTSNRIGLGDILPQKTTDFLGPTLGSGLNVLKAAAEMNGTKVIQAIAPGIGNIMAAITGERKGKRDRTAYVYSTRERLAKAMGFQSVDASMDYDIQDIIRDEKKRAAAEKQAAVDAFLDAERSGSLKDMVKAHQELKRLGIKKKTVDDERKRKGMTNSQRITAGTKKPTQLQKDLAAFVA